MLTNSAVKNLRVRDKAYFEPDSDGLKIKVLPNGRKVWYVRIQTCGRDVHKKIGEWPVMSLAAARHERDILKAADRDGVDIKARKMTFSEGAELWLGTIGPTLAPLTVQGHRVALDKYLLPELGSYPLDRLERQAVLTCLQRVAWAVSPDRARRLAATVTRVMNFALDSGIIKSHDVQRLERALPPHSVTHFSTVLDEKHLAAILRGIWGLSAPVLRTALLSLAYCFPRVGETLQTRWSDIDFDSSVWTLRAAHTKLRRIHLIPFPRQIGMELKNLKEYLAARYGGDIEGLCVFPRPKGNGLLPEHDAIPLRKLKSICRAAGVPDASLHGFRHTASTLLHSHGENTLYIEKQLAHLDPNRIRAVYNQYEFLEERRAMLQRYADFLDSLRDG